MAKDFWIADNECILENYSAELITLDEAGVDLKSQGFDPHEIREMLAEYEIEKIPVGYFGKEERTSTVAQR